MCGLFLISEKNSSISSFEVQKLIKYSRLRGIDNIGVSFIYDQTYEVAKSNLNSKKISQNPIFKKNIGKNANVIFGQCRLVTDGPRYEEKFNQPIINENIIGTHNGIIINYINNSYSENIYSKNDTIEFYKDLNNLIKKEKQNFFNEFGKFIRDKIGIINLIFFNKFDQNFYFYTNNNSLYYYKNKNKFAVASEKEILKKCNFSEEGIFQFKKETLYIFNFKNFELNEKLKDIYISKYRILETNKSIETREEKISKLTRCNKCILPSTYPLIYFDKNGICNYCNSYIKQEFIGVDGLTNKIGPKNTKILYGLSGGRDSSYGLHYLYDVLGYKNIITYTYDWGLTTDTARRNISILSSKYGVENILRSANISNKRSYIKSNIYAWLKRPSLGMVPIFFIGDKPFLYYGTQLRKETNCELTIHGTGFQCEQMEFKVAYCGIDQTLKNNIRMYDFNTLNKIKLFFWYSLQFLKNPHYLNHSLIDNIIGFYSSFIHKDDALHLYNYINYDEDKINQTLKSIGFLADESYGENQWRVGDGQTAFTNFIYYNIGGFSEFDNYRSNQIREGLLTREDAIIKSKNDNKTRFQTIDNFCRIIGASTEDILLRILNIKTLF